MATPIQRPVDALDAVTLISVTYQSRSVVAAMAKTLQQFNHVIVVDNNSNDGTVEALKTQAPHGVYIQRTRNIGFGAGLNAALNETKTEFALLINPDCAISSEDVQILIKTANDFPSAALMSPQILNSLNEVQISCDWAHPLNVPSCVYSVPDGPTSTKLLSGCCLFARVALFKAMNCFDERFFMYFEEKDICRRAVAQGFDCILVPAAVANHAGAASSTPSMRVEHIKLRHYFRSKRLFMAKHEGIYISSARQVLEFLASIVMILLLTLTLQGRRARKWIARAHSYF